MKLFLTEDSHSVDKPLQILMLCDRLLISSDMHGLDIKHLTEVFGIADNLECTRLLCIATLQFMFRNVAVNYRVAKNEQANPLGVW